LSSRVSAGPYFGSDTGKIQLIDQMAIGLDIGYLVQQFGRRFQPMVLPKAQGSVVFTMVRPIFSIDEVKVNSINDLLSSFVPFRFYQIVNNLEKDKYKAQLEDINFQKKTEKERRELSFKI
jgi:uncharacterized protein (DUF697 family)